MSNIQLDPPAYGGRGPKGLSQLMLGMGVGTMMALFFGIVAVWVAYTSMRIDVRTGEQAVLIRRTGTDLKPGQELAPPPENGQYFKGVQSGGPNNGVLTEGRYFYNPLFWDWEIKEQMVIPEGELGIRISLVGEPLPQGAVLAAEGEKGIRREVLRPGRYPYNWYAEQIEIHKPVMVPAQSRGVVTNLAGKLAANPNQILVETGERGVQKETLPPGTYYLNPYETRVSVVDCSTKAFSLDSEGEMDFLSADGFAVTVNGTVTFRVDPTRASEVFVQYNEDENGDAIDGEIISKIITPETRSICRINGSKLTGGQFISGDDREQFQQNLVKSLTENCRKQGVEILEVAITSILPPEAIATPVRAREVAKQQLQQYKQEKLQQDAEAQLKVQQILADQKKAVVEAEQGVIEQITKAEQEQQVAVTLAEQKLAVAQTELDATRDKALAIEQQGEAAAEVIRLKNKAEVAGITTRVKAFDGNGHALAQNMILAKFAPAFQTIMTNTEGPIMDLLKQAFTPLSESDTAQRQRPSVLRPATESPKISVGKPEMLQEREIRLPEKPFQETQVPGRAGSSTSATGASKP
jgi:regulator of protease activity HflC (stomatin/prohibitin superfamily)